MTYTMKFGNYKGETLEWLVFNKPGYVIWLKNELDNGTLYLDEGRDAHLEKLTKRASHLKIPGNCRWCGNEPVSLMYWMINRKDKLVQVSFNCNECTPGGSSTVFQSTPPTLFKPQIFCNDKTADKIVIHEIKLLYYQDPSYRMTQSRLEEFFNNPNNFVNF